MTVLLVCFLILLLAGRVPAFNCSASADALAAPSVVKNTAEALLLAEAVYCHGGSFDVKWVGLVTLTAPIVVLQSTTLNVTGVASSSSWIDGDNHHNLFQVYGGALTLSSLTLFRGSGYHGGSIHASWKSSVTISNCVFISNNATYGGAIFLAMTTLDLSNVNFSSNVAANSGGAIYGHYSTNVVVNGNAVWEANEAIYGGAVRLYHYCSLAIFGNSTFTKNSAGQGGSVWLSEGSNMTNLGSVSFNANTANDGGGLLILNSLVDFLAGSTARFSNNRAVEGGAIHQFGYSTTIFGGRAIFTFNNANRGGAMLSLEGSAFNITGEVTMSNNTASSSGGALHFEAMILLNMHNTYFISNSAGSSGGAVTILSSGTRKSLSILSKCSFNENTAGDAGGAVFIAGGFVDINESSFSSNTAGRSGGAILTSGMTSLAHCLLENNRAYTGPAVLNTVSVSIFLTEFDGNTLLCNDGYFLDFNTNVSAYETACYDCPSEVYCTNCSVRNPEDVQVCEQVPTHTSSLLAEDTIQSLNVQPGFWRSSFASKNVRECYELGACVGGTKDYCAAGYMGPFCTVCTDGYARGLGHICNKCSDERLDSIIAIAVVVLVALVVAVLFGIRFLTSASEVECVPPRQVYNLRLSPFKIARASQALKIVVVSWQIITQFATVASVTYPKVYDKFLKYIDLVNLDLDWILSTGCLVKTDFYVSLLVCTIGPLVFASIVLALYHINSRRYSVYNEEARARLKTKHVSILFWVSVLLYATVSSSIFQTFACDNIDNRKSYLRADHSLECYTTKHKFFMVYAGVMSIVYPFGIPFCYGIILYRHRGTLQMAEGREAATDIASFRDLWQPYRPEMYFYEAVECLRRVFLSGIVVFVFPNTAGQLGTTFLFALLFFVVLMVLNPYSNQRDGWLARIGHAIVMLSMFVALMAKVDTSDDDISSQDVFAGVLVAANCIMILATVAEACGMCFLSIQEMRLHPSPEPSRNNVISISSAMEDNPA